MRTNNFNTKYEMTTQKEIRNSFWNAHPQYKSEYRTKKKQNEYKCDIRQEFCFYIDMLIREKKISEKLGYKVTL